MIQLRPEHIAAFEMVARGEFVAHLTREMRDLFPRQTAGLAPEDLQAVVARMVGKAQELGIRSRSGIYRFASLGMMIGEQRVTSEPVVRFLSHPGVDPEAGIKQLLNELPDSVHAQLAKRPSSASRES